MSATAPESTTPRAKNQPLIEQLDQLESAWAKFAEAAVFAGKSLHQWKDSTAASRSTRTAVETSETALKGNIITRNNADAVSSRLIAQVVAGVVADRQFGSDSPLYRAIGYVPDSERKAPRRKAAPAPGEQAEPVEGASERPKIIERLDKLILAWAKQAPEVIFAGYTRAEFEVAVEPSRTARATRAFEESGYSANLMLRDKADAQTRNLIQYLVGAVKIDPAFGNDCALYRAMGYIPKSERKSPKRKAATPAPAAMP